MVSGPGTATTSLEEGDRVAWTDDRSRIRIMRVDNTRGRHVTANSIDNRGPTKGIATTRDCFVKANETLAGHERKYIGVANLE
jgi:hypothetical protein